MGITYNAAITACDRASIWQRAMAFVDGMREVGLTPNLVTFNATASALARAHRWELALDVVEQTRKRRLGPDATTYTTAVSACVRARRWAIALALFPALRGLRKRVDAAAYNAVLGACAVGSRWADALSLLEGLRRNPHVHGSFDSTSFAAVFGACSAALQWQRAIALLAEAEAELLMPGRQAGGGEGMAMDASAAEASDVPAAVARLRREAAAACINAGMSPDEVLALLAPLKVPRTDVEAAARAGAHHGVVMSLYRLGLTSEAMSAYWRAFKDGHVRPWRRPGVLDLHGLVAEVALVTVLASLSDLIALGTFAFRQPSPRTTRTERDLIIITGAGRHSVAGLPTLLPSVRALLHSELGLVEARLERSGGFRVPAHAIRRLKQAAIGPLLRTAVPVEPVVLRFES